MDFPQKTLCQGERTPLEQLYDAADEQQQQAPRPPSSPIPALLGPNLLIADQPRRNLSEGANDAGGGYDNLERLREEIRRQKLALALQKAGGEATSLWARKPPLPTGDLYQNVMGVGVGPPPAVCPSPQSQRASKIPRAKSPQARQGQQVLKL